METILAMVAVVVVVVDQRAVDYQGEKAWEGGREEGLAGDVDSSTVLIARGVRILWAR